MSIDIEAIKARLPRWGNGDHLALVAEVERLQSYAADCEQHATFATSKATTLERAAVVAWLRGQQEAAEWALTAAGYEHAADAIERGAHRREGEE